MPHIIIHGVSGASPALAPPDTNPKPATTNAPSPQDLQNTINQAIQQAAQNLDQIVGAVTGNTAGANPQATNTAIADNTVSPSPVKIKNDTQSNIKNNYGG